jgi:hypothetical protein
MQSLSVLSPRNKLGSAFAAALLAMLAPDAFAGATANLSRTTVAFAWIGDFVSVTQPVFVTNVGDAPLNISGIVVGGPNPGDFLLGGTCTTPITLTANGGR